ncbi:MAG: hypothetical protein SPI53_03660 [Erysipelotrichaceae bacterium]|nr:hypothetical protein [Erysipelotrichaceae bacterium]
MLKLLLFINKVNTVEAINTLIYFFKKLPLVKKVSSSEYHLDKLKNVLGFFSVLYIIILKSGSMILAHGIVYLIALGLGFLAKSLGFIVSPLILYIAFNIGGIIFAQSIQSYAQEIKKMHNFYCINFIELVLYHININTLFNFIFQTIIFIIASPFIGIDLIKAILLSIIFCLGTYNFSALNLKLKTYKNKKIGYISIPLILIIALSFVLAANFIDFTNNYLLLTVALINIFSMLWAFNYYKHFQTYPEVIKHYTEVIEVAIESTNLSNNVKLKDEDFKQETSNLSGYKMLNDLFFKRHHRILFKPIKFRCYILVAIAVIIYLAKIFFFKDTYDLKIINILPTIILIASYLIYYNQKLIMSMYYNCDNALMNYRFYRQPKAIIQNFKYRYISLLKMMILPAILISLICIEIYWLNIINFDILIRIEILNIILLILFSFFLLLCYYLLQPFTDNDKIKNPLYSFLTTILYILCFQSAYIFKDINIAIIFFGIFTTCFIIVGLILLYKIGHQTFVKKY